MKKQFRFLAVASASALACLSIAPLAGCAEKVETVTLRVCSWEEYIDLGGWEADELIDVNNPYAENPEDGIMGASSMVDDFTEWFNANHDYKINVEYSTFGTNEDLYNRLSLGDVYDLVCPSDYMLMKLIAEGNYVEYSDGFWDTGKEENYYAKYVSRYIDGETDGIFNNPEYMWHKKASCYMWGTLGLVYNPEKLIDVSDVATWNMLLNKDYSRQITIKDNVRDAYFATLGILNGKNLTKPDITASEMSKLMNATDDETIEKAQDILKNVKENVYSFETDSGKADMVTGKVVANEQWSGDAVYIMDEADAEDTELWYSAPDECTNIWFDGWIMLKDGVGGDPQRQECAEAFVNFLSRPDNAVRNMYYIGYTSAIAGQTVFDYMDWNYGMVFDPEDEAFDSEATEVYEYDLSYFFGDGYSVFVDASLLEIDRELAKSSTLSAGAEYGNDIEYTVYSDAPINRGRQMFAQYPPQNVISRSVVMLDFGDRLGDINQMWINVRCLDLLDISPVTVGIVCGVIGLIVICSLLYAFRYRIFINNRAKKGYEKIN